MAIYPHRRGDRRQRESSHHESEQEDIGLLRGESEREKAYVHEEGFYAQQEIELLTGVTATALDIDVARLSDPDTPLSAVGRQDIPRVR
jgi:hypothetical protein